MLCVHLLPLIIDVIVRPTGLSVIAFTAAAQGLLFLFVIALPIVLTTLMEDRMIGSLSNTTWVTNSPDESTSSGEPGGKQSPERAICLSR